MGIQSNLEVPAIRSRSHAWGVHRIKSALEFQVSLVKDTVAGCCLMKQGKPRLVIWLCQNPGTLVNVLKS